MKASKRSLWLIHVVGFFAVVLPALSLWVMKLWICLAGLAMFIAYILLVARRSDSVAHEVSKKPEAPGAKKERTNG